MESPDDDDDDDNKHNNNNKHDNNNNNNNSNSNSNNSYNESVKSFIKSKMSSDPGYFAKRLEQRHYELCQVCPLRRRRREEEEEEEEEIEQIKNASSLSLVVVPILVLPLRINLIRSTILGCSQSLNINSIKPIVEQINNIYWKNQAGIQFNLISVEERHCTLGPTIENDIKYFITHQLKRGTDGKMMYKKERRYKFCNILLSSFIDNNNNNNNSNNDLLETTSNIYDIWFIDMVGQQSQGQCIGRKSRTIIMGERSTKGYNEPTKRPHDCIAKTAAHELGHALLLNHPKGLKFDDGRNQILSSSSKYNNNKNLMNGGSDIKGGGGSYLEQWQCSIARESAQIFLNKHKDKKLAGYTQQE